jgi:hypothetical protein
MSSKDEAQAAQEIKLSDLEQLTFTIPATIPSDHVALRNMLYQAPQLPSQGHDTSPSHLLISNTHGFSLLEETRQLNQQLM